MAVSAPVVTISTGTTGVSVTSNQNWNALVYALGQEKTKMNSMLIWSDNPAQLTQPIRFVNRDPNGDNKQKVITPIVDPYQVVSQINDLKTLSVDGKPFTLDGQNQVEYDILPNTNIRMVVFVADEHSVTTKFLKDNGIETDFSKVIQDLGVEINFMDEVTWKETLPVTQKPKTMETSLVQQDYLHKFVEEKKSNAEEDYMLDEMTSAMDAIKDNSQYENGSIFDVMTQHEGESAQESLNADAAPESESVQQWSKKHLIKPVLIGFGLIALTTAAVVLYRKFVMDKK